MVNRMSLEMYPLLAELANQQPTFEQVVRTNAARGGLPFLNTPEQLTAWIERRLNERRNRAEVAVHLGLAAGGDRRVRPDRHPSAQAGSPTASTVGLTIFAVIYGLDFIATVPPSVRLTLTTFGREIGPAVFAWIFAAHHLPRASWRLGPASVATCSAPTRQRSCWPEYCAWSRP